MKFRSLLLVLTVVLHAAPAFGQDLLQFGIDAYRRGDYPEALKVVPRLLPNRATRTDRTRMGILYAQGPRRL